MDVGGTKQTLPGDDGGFGFVPLPPLSLRDELREVNERLTALAEIPRQAKVYEDYTGKTQVSGESWVKWAAGDKDDSGQQAPTWRQTVSKTVQAISRTYYGEGHEKTIQHLAQTKIGIVATCHLIDQEVELGKVNNKAELEELRSQVIAAQQRVQEAAQKGLLHLVETYQTGQPSKAAMPGTKAEKIQSAVNDFQSEVSVALAASRSTLDAKIASLVGPGDSSPEGSFLSEPTSASSLLLPETADDDIANAWASRVQPELASTSIVVGEEADSPKASDTLSTVPQELPPAPPELSPAVLAARAAAAPTDMVATPVVPAPAQQALSLSERTVVGEDMTVSIDISALTTQARQMPPPSAVQRAQCEKFLREFEIEGISLLDIFNALSPEGKICLQEYLVGYWWQRTFPGEQREPNRQARLDAIAKRLDPIRINGLPLEQALARESDKKIVLLKDALVKYRYTFLLPR